MPDNFEAAVYTDCDVGEGLSGNAGMQFQACTAGMTADLQSVVKHHLLYELPDRLIMDTRPVAEFPHSFAHVRQGDVLATASGRYLGQEVKGTRLGNHLTHAIATREPATYGIVRPAQLAGAAFWRPVPFRTTEAEPPPDDWQQGPITPQAAASFIVNRPAGPAMLAGLVSVLADPRLGGHRQVAIVTDDADAALHLLAAATLLLPQRRALEIGFKVFSIDPARSTLPVVVVHPRWSTFAADVDRDQGYAVFDLTSARWSRTPVDPEAQAWADLFCTTDPDAVAEAVDLADASGLHGVPARAMATAATLEMVPEPGVMPELVRWLGGQGPSEIREAYGEPVVQALSASTDLGVLRGLVQIAEDYPAQRDGILEALLRAEVTEAATLVDRARSANLVRWAVPDHLQPAAREIVTAALRSARPAAFAAILTLAAARDVTVHLDQVSDAADAFITDWLADPSAPHRPSTWRTTPPLLPRIEEAIAKRAERTSMARVLADTWWRILRPDPFTADLTKVLDRALLSAAMRGGDGQYRTALVRKNFAAAKDRHRGDRGVLRDLAKVLWKDGALPDLEQLLAAADHVTGEPLLDPAIAVDVGWALERGPRTPTALADWRAVMRSSLFDAQNEAIREVTRRLEDLEVRERRVRDMLRKPFDATHPTAEAVRNDLVLIRQHDRTFVERLRALNDPAHLHDLLTVLPRDLIDDFLRRTAEDARTGTWSPPRAAVIFTLLSRYRPETFPNWRESHAACGKQLDGWTASHLPTQLHEAMICLERMSRLAAEDWQRYADQHSRPPMALSSHLQWLRDKAK